MVQGEELLYKYVTLEIQLDLSDEFCKDPMKK